MQIERLGASDFAPDKRLVYVDVAKMFDMYDAMAFKANAILVGPKGIGKSLGVAAYAAKIDSPVITFDCSEDIRRSHLMGTFVLRGSETPFVLGPIPTAFEIANEVGKCVLVLEEINSLTPQMQKCLNPLTDFRKKIEIPEAERVFRLREGAQLWVVGTMNFSVYGGVYALNEDLKSRFRLITMNYPKPRDEASILSAVLDSLHVKIEEKHVTAVLTLAHETRQQALDYSLSTRDVIQILEDAASIGLKKALWVMSGKFEGDDRTTFRERVKSIFPGMDIDD